MFNPAKPEYDDNKNTKSHDLKIEIGLRSEKVKK